MSDKKYIITQIPPEHAQLDYYFEGDCFTERAGGLEYALFIIGPANWRDFNGELYSEIQNAAEGVIEGFADAADGLRDYNGDKITCKAVMQEFDIKYSPTMCHRLKEWSKDADERRPADIARYLSITTGRPWTTTSATGYCQGDYCEIVYCADVYSRNDARAAGEIYLGAANEYSITFPAADDESEPETVYGYIVADCQAWSPEDVKTLVCSYEGIDPADAVLMLIEDSYTRTEYKYTEAC